MAARSRWRAIPLHPASLGGTSAIGQAEILGFYDPDRSRGLIRRWRTAGVVVVADGAGRAARCSGPRGAGFRILTGTTTSPTLGRQIAALQKRYPAMRWHRWEPVSRDAVRAGAMLAYGQPVEIVPKLDSADLLVTIDSDLLDSRPVTCGLRAISPPRRNPTRTERMSRVYALEPTPTLTGVAADHRFVAARATWSGSCRRWRPRSCAARHRRTCRPGSRRWPRTEGSTRARLCPCGTASAGRNPRAGACDERGSGRPRRDLHADRSSGGRSG